MSTNIRIVHTLTWDPPEVAGGTFRLENGSSLYLHGVGVPLFKDIVEALNLSATHIYANYHESMALVANNTADVGTLTVTHSELYTKSGVGTTIAYLHPLNNNPSMIFFRQPPAGHKKTSIFLPFTTLAWVTMFVFNVLIAFLITRKSHPFTAKYFLKLVINALIFCADRFPLIRKNSKNRPTSLFRDKVKLVKLFFGVYFISLYTAKFVSVFVLKENIIKSPEDLIKQNYVFSSYSPIHIDRLFSSKQIRQLIKRKVLPVNGFKTIRRVIGRHRPDPRHALLSLLDGFNPQALYGLKYSKELCLVSTFESIVKTPRCPYIRKDSPFREMINLKILQMIERGINHRLERNHKQKFLYKCPTEKAKVNVLHFHHMSIGHFILFLGACVAILLNSKVAKKFL